jgi:hypothetical protein
MHRLKNSVYVENATLIRLNAERAAQLEDLGKETNAIIKGIEGDLVPEINDGTGADNVSVAGS